MATQALPVQDKQINKAWFYFEISLFVFGAQTAVLMVPALLVESRRALMFRWRSQAS